MTQQEINLYSIGTNEPIHAAKTDAKIKAENQLEVQCIHKPMTFREMRLSALFIYVLHGITIKKLSQLSLRLAWMGSFNPRKTESVWR